MIIGISVLINDCFGNIPSGAVPAIANKRLVEVNVYDTAENTNYHKP